MAAVFAARKKYGIVFLSNTKNKTMKGSTAVAGGLSGAAVLTIIHETVRRLHPDAPRMDLLGMQALAKALRKMGKNPPPRNELYGWTLAGDVVGNAIFYGFAAAGRRKNVLVRGLLLGVGAGLGAVLLPRPLGLNEKYSNRTAQTKVATMGLYIIGGLVASVVMKVVDKRQKA